MYFCCVYGLSFNLTWLPLFLRDGRGFTAQQAGLGSGVVLMGGAIGTWTGGRLTDALVRRHGLRLAVRLASWPCR